MSTVISQTGQISKIQVTTSTHNSDLISLRSLLRPVGEKELKLKLDVPF